MADNVWAAIVGWWNEAVRKILGVGPANDDGCWAGILEGWAVTLIEGATGHDT